MSNKVVNFSNAYKSFNTKIFLKIALTSNQVVYHQVSQYFVLNNFYLNESERAIKLFSLHKAI